VAQRRDATKQVILETLEGVQVWLGEWSAVHEALFLPTGALDFPIAGATTENPPPNRVRLRYNAAGTAFEFVDDVGTVYPIGGGAGVSDFLALLDTPASYAGQAGLVAAVNAGETGMEFVAQSGGGSGSGLARLRSMPSACGFIDAAGADDGKQTARQYQGLGLILVEGFQVYAGTGGPASPGDESDDAGGRTSFVELSMFDDTPGVNATNFTLRIAMPEGFTEWGDDGIRWYTKVISATGPGGQIDPTIEVFNPLTGASYGPMQATRAVPEASLPETAYVILQITKAQLDAELADFTAAAAGDGVFKLKCSFPALGGFFPGEQWITRLGAIDIDWVGSGGGGGGPTFDPDTILVNASGSVLTNGTNVLVSG
jgi:hypothetical protein